MFLPRDVVDLLECVVIDVALDAAAYGSRRKNPDASTIARIAGSHSQPVLCLDEDGDPCLAVPGSQARAIKQWAAYATSYDGGKLGLSEPGYESARQLRRLRRYQAGVAAAAMGAPSLLIKSWGCVAGLSNRYAPNKKISASAIQSATCKPSGFIKDLSPRSHYLARCPD